MLGGEDARALEGCIASGGVAVVPTDTVYGLACDPLSRKAVRRLYELKGRPEAKPAAVMFFSRQAAVGALPELGEGWPRTRAAVDALLPGPVTVLIEQRRVQFPLAAAPDGSTPPVDALLGLRVPAWPPQLAALALVGWAALQSSANLSGGEDPRSLSMVPESIRQGADLVIDAGELPGVASTVVSLASFERSGEWSVVREGAVPSERIAGALADVIARC